MNKRELEKALEREIEHWPGVTVEFIDGGKHPKARYTFEGTMLSHPYASTPGDTAFGVHRMLGDHRRILKRLGAVRDKPEPSREEDDAPYRKPNDGAAKRPDPVAREKVAPEPTVATKLATAGVAKVISIPDEDQSDAEAEREARQVELENMIAAITDGIYFGLPEEVYHAVPALGGSAITQIGTSPADFWKGSWLDPDRPELDEEATEAQIVGRAYHCARLEPEQLEVRFVGELDKKTMPPGSLFTGPQMSAKLKEMGVSPVGGSVAEQAERLADNGFPIEKLWHVALTNWQREVGARQKIKAKVWGEILIDMERIRNTPEIASKLTGGAAEVAIFWTDDKGVRCKCKLDYLTVEHWAELKTFENTRRKKVRQAIIDAVQYNGYYITAAHYRDGVEAIRTGGLQIRGPSTDAQRELIARIQIAPRPLELWFIFQQKGGVPNLFADRFEFSAINLVQRCEIEALMHEGTEAERAMAREALSAITQIYRRGMIEVQRAKDQFLLYSQVYPPGEPWRPIDPEGTIGDIDFHPRFLEGNA